MSPKELHNIFEYKDGVLYWKIDRGTNKTKGMIAGSPHQKGYLRVRVNGKLELVHRIIFCMHNGYLPEFVDHIDNNTENNRIENLREATKSENSYNQIAKTNNKSGMKGVMWHKSVKRWAVQITVNKVKKYLGSYEDKELAELVAMEARDKFHGKFARHA